MATSKLDVATHDINFLNECQDSKLEAIICVAGGFAGGSVKAKGFLSAIETSVQQSIWDWLSK